MKLIVALFLMAVMISCGAFTSVSDNALQRMVPNLSKAEANTHQIMSFHFSSPEQHLIAGRTFVTVTEAPKYINLQGAPRLPYVTRTLVLPAGAQIEDVKITRTEERIISLSQEIVPAAEALSHNHPKPTDPTPDNAIYTSFAPYPANPVQYHSGLGLHEGSHVMFFSVQVFPVQYWPAAQEISFTTDVTIDVQYNVPGQQAFTNDVYDLLIIAPYEFTNELQRLVEHKQQYGLATRLVTLSNIYDGTYFSVEGRDEAEQIKYFIKDAVEEWGVTYVLMVGNPAYTPCRRVLSFAWGDHEQYSDHYYADLYAADLSFCTWDSNHNNQFGEVYDAEDYVDLYADVYVGRLACGNLEEVTTVVDKIITYETSAYHEEWFSRMILLGGDTFPRWGIYEGELVNAYVADEMSEFDHIFIQMQEGNFLPHLINQIWSQGAGFVCYSGHGFEYGFGTYPHDNNWMIAYYTPYLLDMNNGNMLPIVFFDACLTAKLDYHMLGMEDVPCFAWCLVKKPDGGAIATIGATETAITSVDEEGVHGQAGYLDLHFFMAYKPGIHLAHMLVSAQNDYLNSVARGTADDRLYKMTVEQFILLGDPILKVGGYP
jgi:hypothetical protein